ncbi:GNAT family N-acetyltransferase [bacterium]|nr:GNAT family N-acetyltransferase [bacterium]
MEIRIRSATEADLDTLVEFHRLFMAHHATGDARFALRPGAADGWRAEIARALADPDVLALVAEAAGEPVGCAFTLLKPGARDFGDERIGYLCDVYVVPAWRRSGVARKLLARTENWLQDRGIGTLEASWALGSREAADSWPALGFAPLSVTGRKTIT